MFKFLARAWKLHKEETNKAKELLEIRLIATFFNNRYTYKKRWKGSSSYTFCWMCPECNKIHEAKENSFLTGMQYPACCSYPEGHRLFDDIKWR